MGRIEQLLAVGQERPGAPVCDGADQPALVSIFTEQPTGCVVIDHAEVESGPGEAHGVEPPVVLV